MQHSAKFTIQQFSFFIVECCLRECCSLVRLAPHTRTRHPHSPCSMLRSMQGFHANQQTNMQTRRAFSCAVCAFHGVSPRDRWGGCLAACQRNVNLTCTTSLRDEAPARACVLLQPQRALFLAAAVGVAARCRCAHVPPLVCLCARALTRCHVLGAVRREQWPPLRATWR